MMPTFLGSPFYPAGCPLRPEQIIMVNDETLQDIVLRYWEGKSSSGDKEVLKEYVLYYISAPLFRVVYDNDEQEQNFKLLPLDDMLDVLLDSGIDPL